ncbi:MAG: T9SS type A sorting domain-containing protein [Candidatus Delongbacteria bacterium]|jgi:hypothetical protein|nr:T9SS type A sorting domain-containing protein [Candidatus Delongbacteria bacterium]
MRKVVLVSFFVFTLILKSQTILWKKNIPLDWEFFRLIGIDAASNGNTYIGIQDDPLKVGKFTYGDSWVYGIDNSDGQVSFSSNYGDIFNYGFEAIAANYNGFFFAGENSTGDPWGSTSTNLYSTEITGDISDSIVYEPYMAEKFYTNKLKYTSDNRLYHHYSDYVGYPDGYTNDSVVEHDSVLNYMNTFNVTHEDLPSSILYYYDYYEYGNYPLEYTFLDFCKTGSGILLSGYIGGWTSRFNFTYIKHTNEEKEVAWEMYFPFYDSEIFPNGRITFFRDLTYNSYSNSFLATLWRDEDMDYDEEPGELYMVNFDNATGDILWLNTIDSRPDQLLNYGDSFLIRKGTSVIKADISELGLDTLWVKDYPNTGKITVVDNGYISASIVESDLYVYRFDERTNIEDSSPLPASAALYQNYPNPFNPVTEISFSIPETSEVDLSVYDTAGRLVRTLVNEKRTYGRHTISFDGSDLNSGIYFYRLQTDGRMIDAKRMLLIK